MLINKFRIGQGWDRHRLEAGKTLILGNVPIPSEKGSVAHSDGDVLLHALIDALLGAIAFEDIGAHFPPSDPQYKNCDSAFLLKKVLEWVTKKGFSIVNIDSTIVLEKPVLRSFIPPMQKKLANLCRIDEQQISIKAKSGEKCDSVGQEKAIEAMVIVLLQKRRKNLFHFFRR